MAGKGKGWHDEPRRHSLAGKGVKTVVPGENRRLAVDKFVAMGEGKRKEIHVLLSGDIEEALDEQADLVAQNLEETLTDAIPDVRVVVTERWLDKDNLIVAVHVITKMEITKPMRDELLKWHVSPESEEKYLQPRYAIFSGSVKEKDIYKVTTSPERFFGSPIEALAYADGAGMGEEGRDYHVYEY